MKKLYIFLLVLCLTFSFVFVAAAADDPSEDYVIQAGTYVLNDILTDFTEFADGGSIRSLDFLSNGISFDAFWFRNSSSKGPVLTFRISDSSSYYYIYGTSQGGYFYDSERGTDGQDFRVLVISSSQSVPNDFYHWFAANTTRLDGDTSPTFNLYQSLYRIIVEYVFNGEGVTDGILDDQMQHLVVTLVATVAWLFCVSVPFVVVYWVIKVICTGFGRF